MHRMYLYHVITSVGKRYPFHSSSSLEPTAASHHGYRLIHNPFADPEISVNPGLYLFALADGGGFDTGWSGWLVSLDRYSPKTRCRRLPRTEDVREASAPLDSGEKGRNEDGVEGVVCQAT